MLLAKKGKYEEAEPLCREVLEVRRETLGNRHPHTLIAMGTLAVELHSQGKYDEAEPLFREVLEATRETLGNRQPATLTSINDLGMLLQAKGNCAAEPLLREALQGRRGTLGNQHPSTLASINNLDQLLLNKGKLRLAEKLYGPPLRWLCGARRLAVGTRVRFGPRRASVAPEVGCS